jgi:hypothetical protein
VLWDPAAHEPLACEWDEVEALAAIGAIVADAEEAFDGGWRIHPRDFEPGDHDLWRGTHIGGAGVVDAFRRLEERGHVELQRDYLEYLEGLEPDEPGPGLMLGETGILLVRQRLFPSETNTARLRELVAENASSEARELLVGSPGTMLAARELGFDDLWQESAERLLAARDSETGLWEQTLWGKTNVYLGAAHGFAGCVQALGELEGGAETARRHAIVEDGLANWPGYGDGQLVRNDTIRVQWCTGAPGMITGLGDVLDEDLALAGGELTWRAGPIVKSPGLCHGTAGNGYAFLRLFARTGDELWLDRARHFAAHAIDQVERTRAKHGRGWHTLWTGDLGVALYLADCVAGGGRLPLP